MTTANGYLQGRAAAGWHVVYAVIAATTLVLMALCDRIGGPGWLLRIGLLGALCMWYATAGRTALRDTTVHNGLSYLAGAAVLTFALFAVVPIGALMLFPLYPHVWALLPFRSALVGTAVTAAGVTGDLVLHPGMSQVGTSTMIGTLVASLTLALGLGLWARTVVDHSRRTAALVTTLETTRAQLAEVSREAGRMAERERLASEIHDTLAQGFTSILLLLQAMETESGAKARAHLRRAQETARENLAEARSLVAVLVPPSLAAASLTDALAGLVARFGDELGVRALFHATGTPAPAPIGIQVVLLRAAQEALANVRKHSGAKTVEVSLWHKETSFVLGVRDDGRGFDPAGRYTGFGLAGMHRRVHEVGGTVRVDSAPGAGTTIRVEVPAP